MVLAFTPGTALAMLMTFITRLTRDNTLLSVTALLQCVCFLRSLFVLSAAHTIHCHDVYRSKMLQHLIVCKQAEAQNNTINQPKIALMSTNHEQEAQLSQRVLHAVIHQQLDST